MKSYIGAIIVLAIFGLAMGNFALAQDPLEEAPEEAIAETTQPQVSTSRPVPSPEKVTEPPPPIEPLNTVVASEVEPPGMFTPAGPYVATSVARGRTAGLRVLIIPAEEVKTEDLAAIWQDLCVMLRIFDKKFSKSSYLIREVFPDYGNFFERDNRPSEAIYLQGYGALFLMEANFPLTPPPKSKEKEAKKTEEPADPIWQQAKQEIFSPIETTRRRPRLRVQYDAEKIEEVKKELIKSLKHAANVRNLKPDEWIILTVIGKSRGYGGGSYGSSTSDYGGGGAVNVRRSYSASGGRYRTTRIVPGGTGVGSSTVLTIRAKKSDVDAFAKSELDFEKFREKVQILTYPYLEGQLVGLEHRVIHEPGEPEYEGRLPIQILPSPKSADFMY